MPIQGDWGDHRKDPIILFNLWKNDLGTHTGECLKKYKITGKDFIFRRFIPPSRYRGNRFHACVFWLSWETNGKRFSGM